MTAAAQAAVLELIETLSACVAVSCKSWKDVRDDVALPSEKRVFATQHCKALRLASEALDLSEQRFREAQAGGEPTDLVLAAPLPVLQAVAASVIAFEQVHQPREADLPEALTPERLAPALALALAVLPQTPEPVVQA